MASVAYTILALLGFGFIIFIHELGHFLAAKMFRVKVKAFSLGFPPNILHKQLGETDYRLGIIPLGGYVSMVGEDPAEAVGNDPRALSNLRPWKRAVVFLAGVVMNMVSAVAILVVASLVGLQVDSPTVGGTQYPSPARSAGFQPGDRIVSIDGREILSFPDIRAEIIMGAVRNSDHRFEVMVEGRQEPIYVSATSEGGLPSIGVVQSSDAVVGQVVKGDAAAQAGLRTGDRIRSINGEAMTYGAQCQLALDPMPKVPFTIEVERTLKLPAEKPDPEDAKALPADELRESDVVVSIDGVAMASPQDARTTLKLRAEVTPDQPMTLVIRRTLVVDPAAIRLPDYGIRPQVQVREVFADSAAEAAGLKVGDYLLRVADVDYPSGSQIIRATQQSAGSPMSVIVWRDGEEVPLMVTPRLDERRGYCMIGFAMGGPKEPVIRRLGEPGAATTDAGIPEGSMIVSINGHDVEDWDDVGKLIVKADGDPIEMGYTPPDSAEVKTVTVTPRRVTPEVFPLAMVEEPISETLPPMNPLKALVFSWNKVDQMVRLQYYSVVGIFNKRVPAKEVGGPIRIGAGLYKTAEKGWSHYVLLVALISMAIAMLNAMPIPPLDGGHVMFLCIEAIIRRPVPPKVRSVVSTIGLVALLSLVAFAFWNDGWWVFQQMNM